MKSFCLEGKIFDKYENIKIGKPSILGIKEVNELLSLIKLMLMPHIIRNIA
tara:strand:- start:23 stop:175 length:153 start_codon:yes stop_codon:yes gene_type:complete